MDSKMEERYGMNNKLVQENGFMPWEQNPECFKINKRAAPYGYYPFPHAGGRAGLE